MVMGAATPYFAALSHIAPSKVGRRKEKHFMAKNKYVVTSAYGTFKRSTDRTYTHFVISRGFDPQVIKNMAAKELASAQKQLAKYSEAAELAAATGKRVDIEDGCSIKSAEWLRANHKPAGTLRVDETNGTDCRVGFTAAEWSEYRDGTKQRIDTHEARLAKKLAEHETAKYGVHGWCGRPDLAIKLADRVRNEGMVDVHIITVATGHEL